MIIDKSNIIKCPYCGYEYLPCEIFYPDDLLGTATNVVRDDKGEIIYVDGEDMNIAESYICDHCGKEFGVTADVSFKSHMADIDFDDAFAEPLN